MTWEEAAAAFVAQATAYLDDLRAQLIAAGASPAGLIVSTPDTTDLTVQLAGTRGARNGLLYFELVPIRGGPEGDMQVYVKLTLSVNGTIVGTSFVPAAAELFTDAEGLDRAIAILAESAGLKPELLAKLRTGLGV